MFTILGERWDGSKFTLLRGLKKSGEIFFCPSSNHLKIRIELVKDKIFTNVKQFSLVKVPKNVNVLEDSTEAQIITTFELLKGSLSDREFNILSNCSKYCASFSLHTIKKIQSVHIFCIYGLEIKEEE